MKILRHVTLEATSPDRGVVVVVIASPDVAHTFVNVVRRLARHFCTRDDPDVNFVFIARLVQRSVEDLEGLVGVEDVLRRLADLVEETLKRTLALEDKEAWSALNDCKKRLIRKAA